MLSNFGPGEKKQSSLFSHKQIKIHSTPYHKHEAKSAFISDEWEAALTEECEFKFILDQVSHNISSPSDWPHFTFHSGFTLTSEKTTWSLTL